MKSHEEVAVSNRSSFPDKKTKGKGYANGSSGKDRIGFARQMVAFA
jgi:hypothetical protein